MLKKQEDVYEIKGSEKRIYRFYCQKDAPLSERYEALSQMKTFCMGEMNVQDLKQDEKLKQ